MKNKYYTSEVCCSRLELEEQLSLLYVSYLRSTRTLFVGNNQLNMRVKWQTVFSYSEMCIAAVWIRNSSRVISVHKGHHASVVILSERTCRALHLDMRFNVIALRCHFEPVAITIHSETWISVQPALVMSGTSISKALSVTLCKAIFCKR